MSRVFGVNDFGQQKFGERFAFGKNGTLFDGRPKNLYVFWPAHRHSVMCVLRARIYGTYDDKNVLELRSYIFRGERKSARFLKDDRHDVISYVSLPE